ncbi:MAG: L-2-hydroxyglutarate oxidase [Verrucomicrobiales bacterium]|nr:L-2-hydroxyglutarate oxidase [Verrucomicrobiales bacterium]
MIERADIVIIGGGVVGLATAYHLKQIEPKKSIVVLEKEAVIAAHQTGNNSGVIHSGIYYKPGSLKAINCRKGKLALEKFCKEQGVNYESCGKVIVATSKEEIPTMNKIYDRGKENGVSCKIIDDKELKDLEPHAAGVAAIHVPEAGIINYKNFCSVLAEKIQLSGGKILLGEKVNFITPSRDKVNVQTENGLEFEAGKVINCAGLYSDIIADKGGAKSEMKIIPFRGEYYELTDSAKSLVKNLIYPVPDPNFPFLGVHFTRMIDGGVECGPNAVLAFAREGYGKLKINPNELLESLCYPGFIKLASKYWKTGLGEIWRSLSKQAFVKALSVLVPEIKSEDLKKAPAGVRAQAVSVDGSMVDDFYFSRNGNVLNVCNAPSPAATASLNIAKVISEKISDK